MAVPTPRRCTVVICYSGKGHPYFPIGFGPLFRRLQDMIMADCRNVSVIANGSIGMATYPLHIVLSETGQSIGCIDWNSVRELANEENIALHCHNLAVSVRQYVTAYLKTEFAKNPSTGKLEHPAKFYGSGSYYNAGKGPLKKKKKKGSGRKKKKK